MSGHPCGSCLRWWECNGVAWGSTDCPHWQKYTEENQPPKNKAVPAYLDDRTESGLLED